MILELGDSAPAFKLAGIDEKDHALADYAAAKALAVVFTCNHCPYAQAYEGRFNALQTEFESRGFQLLAINSNDGVAYPEDDYEAMVLRAQEKDFQFPYLWDEDQSVAKAYGAVRTPHVFLFNAERKLAYVGRVDDSWNAPEKVTRRELAEAIADILEGQAVRTPETFAVGCTIKWKEEA